VRPRPVRFTVRLTPTLTLDQWGTFVTVPVDSKTKCLFPRRSGETIQKLAIPPTANQRMFHITTNPIARDIVARNKHVYFGRTMELGVSFSDFEHLQNALKNFSDETFQVFVIDDCKLISTANKM